MKGDKDGVLLEIEERDIKNGKLVIPNKVTKIDKYAFDGLRKNNSGYWYNEKVEENIEEIELSDSVKEIEEGAFRALKNLKKIVLSNNLKTIPKHCFEFCSELESIIIPDSVTSIGEGAFGGCEKLSHLIIPDSVEELDGENIFYRCQNMSYLYLSKNIKEIERKVFNFNNNLAEIVLPENLEHIKRNDYSHLLLFSNDYTKVVLPENFSFFHIPEHLNFMFEKSEVNREIFFKTQQQKDKVLALEKSNLRKDSYRTASILENYKKIKVEERSKVKTKLSMLDVKDRRKLKSIKIDDYDMIDEATFAECENLEEVIIGEGTKVIGRGAFAYCKNLKRIVLPESLEYIQNDAFRECDNLQQIVISKNLKQIGDRAFYKCENLKIVAFNNEKNKLETIGENAFYECNNLGAIPLSKLQSLKEIKMGAFRNCKKINSLAFPESLEIIGDEAFMNCASEDYEFIEPIIKENSNSEISKIEYKTTKIPNKNTIISFSKNLKSIGQSAFEGCKNLIGVVFNKECDLEEISQSTFEECDSLEFIDLPNKVKKIGEKAFKNCKSLLNIELPASTEEIGEESFSNCDSLILVITEGNIKQEYNSFSNTKNINFANKKNLELSNTEIIDGKIYEVISSKTKSSNVSFKSIKQAIGKVTKKER